MIEQGPYDSPTMSVTELIAELQKIPNPDTTPVITEGCDCNGEVFSVSIESDGSVYLMRKPYGS